MKFIENKGHAKAPGKREREEGTTMLRNQEWRHSSLSLCNGTNAAKKTSFSSVDASARLLSLRTIHRVFLANRSKILPYEMGNVESSVFKIFPVILE